MHPISNSIQVSGHRIFFSSHHQLAIFLSSVAVVVFQLKFYIPLAFILCFALRTAIGSLWGDAMGAYLYAGVVCRVFVWHVTFCINRYVQGEPPVATCRDDPLHAASHTCWATKSIRMK